jgi:branched-chain amino acid transport system ATP-binding protein
MSLLKVEGVNFYYGDVQVLNDVSFHILEKEIVALVGTNGAGKSTMINAISGIHYPRSGKILLRGEAIHKKPSYFIVEKGIVQVPEGRRVFPSLTVLENLELGSFLPTAKRMRKKVLGEVYELFPILRDRKDQAAGTLSGGEQQMLVIGRALMSLPSLLMLDEPSLGLAPLIVANIFQVISRVNKQGSTVLLVEQNVEHTLEIVSRGYVLENGSIVLEGTGKELLNNPHVKEAYLGI